MPTKKKKTQRRIDPFFMAQRAQIALGAGADFHSRRIYIVGEIGPETTGRVLSTLPIMDEEKGPITLVLASSGGSEPDGYAIYDAVKMTKNPVVIIALGACQSIAALIIQAGAQRLMTPECRFMIHNGSLELGGAVDMNTLISISKEVENANSAYYRILAERSGLAFDEVKKLCHDESYFDAKSAVSHGFADAVLLPDGRVLERDDLKPRDEYEGEDN